MNTELHPDDTNGETQSERRNYYKEPDTRYGRPRTQIEENSALPASSCPT